MGVAKYCGLTWEADFWRVLNSVVCRKDTPFLTKFNRNGSSDNKSTDICETKGDDENMTYLDLKFDSACENYVYANYQKERLCLHETKCRYENNHLGNGSNYDIEAMVS